MTLTITLKKLHLAIVVLAAALIVPTTAAVAFHIFDDVPDDAFYSEPVEWAFANAITTGKSPTTFDPFGPVTRGESVTFLRRYDDNVVQPALDMLDSGIGNLEAGLAETYTRGQVDAAIAAAGSTVLWARIDADAAGATVLHGTPGITAHRLVPGVYEIDFPQGIVECAWVATRNANDAAQALPGIAVVERKAATDSDSLWVRTMTLAGVEADPADDQGFTVQVLC